MAYSGPNLRWTAENYSNSLTSGWNDAIFAGTTQAGNPQVALLHPVKFLVQDFDVERSFGIVTTVTLILLVLGFSLLMRELEAKVPAASVASLAFLASGSVTTRLWQFEQISVIGVTPLVCACVLRAARRRTLGSLVGLAMSSGLWVAAGHPQTLVITAPLIAAFFVIACREGRWGIAASFGGLVGGLGLTALHWMPALGTKEESVLAGKISRSVTSDYSAVPRFLLRTVLGSPFDVSGFQAEMWEAAGGLTAIGCLFAICAIVGMVRHAEPGKAGGWVRVSVFAPAIVALVATVLAVGPRWFPYRVSSAVVPFFSGMRVPGRFNALGSLALAILAGVGAGFVFSRKAGRIVLVAVVAMMAALALVAFSVFRRPSPAAIAWWCGSTLVLVAVVRLLSKGESRFLVSGVVVGWMVIESFVAWNTSGFSGPKFSPTLEADRATWVADKVGTERVLSVTFDKLDDPKYLVSTLRPNTNLFAGIRSLDGYDGGFQVRQRWVEAMKSMTVEGRFNIELTLRSQIAHPLDAPKLARFGVAWVVAEYAGPGENPSLPGWGPPIATLGTVGLYRNPSFVSEVRQLMRTEQLGDRQVGTALREVNPSTAIVETDNAAIDCSISCEPVPLPQVKRSPGRIEVTLASRDGLVVVPEQFGKGWTLKVDGKPRPVVIADGWALGARVSENDKGATFEYVQPGLRLGMYVSIATLLLSGMSLIFRKRQFGRRRSDPTESTE